MSDMTSAKHSSPICRTKDGKVNATNWINPPTHLRLGANVDDTGVAQSDSFITTIMLKIAKDLAISGCSIEFYPSYFHNGVDFTGNAPTVWFNNAAGNDSGGIRWNSSTQTLQFRHRASQDWLDLGSGSGGGGNVYKIIRTVNSVIYELIIHGTTADLEFWEGGARKVRIVPGGASNAAIVFDEDVQISGTNSDIDLNDVEGKVLIGKPLDIETESWRIYGTGISTGLTSRGGYTQDV